MQRSRGLLVVVALGALLAASCGDAASNGPASLSGPGGTAESILDCPDDGRIVTMIEPSLDFPGHPSPEAAVMAAASLVPVTGTPRNLEGDLWVVVAEDGRAVARTRVGAWEQGWLAADVTACEP